MVKGIVSFSGDNKYNGKTLYSFRLADDNNYYNCGTDKPNVSKGQLIEFEAAPGHKPNAFQVDLSSINVLKEASTEVVQASVGGFRKTWPKKDVAKDDYWNSREARDIKTQSVIQLQSSRNSAIALAELIIDNSGIDLEKAKSKKMDIIVDLVALLTAKFEADANAKREGEKMPAVDKTELETATAKVDDGEWE